MAWSQFEIGEIEQLQPLVLLVTDHQYSLVIETHVPGTAKHAWLQTLAPETPQEVPSWCEDADSVIANLGHHNVAVAVHRYPERCVELTLCCPSGSEFCQELSKNCENIDAMVPCVCQHHTIIAGCNACSVRIEPHEYESLAAVNPSPV